MALRQLEHLLSRVAVVCRSGGGRHGGAATFSCRPSVRSSGFHSSTAACTVEGPSHVADIKTIEVEGLQAPTQVVEFVPLGGDDSDPTQHTASVLLMHGLGDTAMGWTDAVSGFFAPAMPHVKFILPVSGWCSGMLFIDFTFTYPAATGVACVYQTAPTQPVTLNMGMPMPSWVRIACRSGGYCLEADRAFTMCHPPQYDLKGLSERQNEDCDGIEASRNVVNALLEQVQCHDSDWLALLLQCSWHHASPPRSLSRSHALRGDLTAQESKAGIPMSRIVLSGFSQGGALALYCAMHQSTAPAGVLAMSA